MVKESHFLFQNTVSWWLSQFAYLLVGFITVISIARAPDLEGYSVIASAYIFIVLFNFIANLGFTYINIFQLSSNPSHVRSVLMTNLCCSIGLIIDSILLLVIVSCTIRY